MDICVVVVAVTIDIDVDVVVDVVVVVVVIADVNNKCDFRNRISKLINDILSQRLRVFNQKSFWYRFVCNHNV